MVRFSLPVLAGLAFLSCNPNSSNAPANKARTVEEITVMFDHFFNDIRATGLTAEFKYLDHSPEFFWVPPGYTSALNYDSVKVILEQNASTFESIEYSWDTVQIFPLTDDIATYTGIVRGAMTDTAGNRQDVALIESGTLIRRADGWKYLNGQTAVLPEEHKSPD